MNELSRAKHKVSLIVVSDRLFAGEIADRCAPAARAFFADKDVEILSERVIADGIESVSTAIGEVLRSDRPDLLLTIGGTGVSARDLTPEGTARHIHRMTPGIAEAMRAASLKKTPNAVLSRALAGFSLDGALIINLPGSPSGAIENLEAIWDGAEHGMRKARGDQTPCQPL